MSVFVVFPTFAISAAKWRVAESPRFLFILFFENLLPKPHCWCHILPFPSQWKCCPFIIITLYFPTLNRLSLIESLNNSQSERLLDEMIVVFNVDFALVVSKNARFWRLGTVGLPLSPHSTLVTSYFLPILLLCWNNSLLSIQLAHPHSSKLLRQLHVLPTVPGCTDVFLLSRTKRCHPKRGQNAFSWCRLLVVIVCAQFPVQPTLLNFTSVEIKNSYYLLVLLSFLFLVSFPKI